MIKPQTEDLAARRLQKGVYFLDNWLAVVSIGVLAIITICLFGTGSQGFTTWNMENTMQQFCLTGSLSLTALVSMRTGGLDLSVGSVMALSSVILGAVAENNVGFGVLLAFIICGALGLMNGVLIMVFHLPAILVTVASSMLIWGIAMWVGNDISVSLPAEWPEMNVLPAALALIASLGVALLALRVTGGLPRKNTNTFKKKKYFWIYGLVAVMGVFAGWAAALCFRTSDTNFGSGSSDEMIILFIFATISASSLLKNNWIALGGALVLAMLWTIHDQAMILLELNPFSMIVSNASWVIIMLTVLTVAKRKWKNLQ